MELSVSSQDGNISVHFVYCTEGVDDAPESLRYTYQACAEYELSIQWLKEAECLKIQPAKQDVFVFDPFEGPAFDYISSSFRSVRVLGPRCLLSCLVMKMPVPEYDYPLHNIAMHGLVVCLTGFDKEEKNKFRILIERMSGIYSQNYHEAVTHVVVKTVGSDKHMKAIDRETPVMRKEWVTAVWEKASQDFRECVSATHEQFVKYTCRVFEGMNICISQLSKEEKQSFVRLIEEHGGICEPTLSMHTTTILVIPTPEGNKYKYAVSWRIPCVSIDWIHDSIEHGSVLPHEKYSVTKKPRSSTPTHDNTIHCVSEVSLISTIANETMAGRTHIDESICGDVSMLPKTDRQKVDTDIDVTCLAKLDASLCKKAGMFLDSCRVFVSGFREPLMTKVIKILNAGGAIRMKQLTDDVTHVVVGSHVPEHMRLMESWSCRPHVVIPAWIVESMERGRPANEEEFQYRRGPAHALPASPAFRKPLERVASNRTQEVDETSNETCIDEDLMKQYMGKNAIPRVNETEQVVQRGPEEFSCSALPDSQRSPSKGIFKGCIFTVSGFEADILDEMREVIAENGGVVVGLTHSGPVHYSVMSLEGEGTMHDKASHCISHLYIEDCLEQEELLPVEYFHIPILLRDAGEPLSGCVLATSSYKGKERTFLMAFCLKLGAVFQDMFAKSDSKTRKVKRSTHLVCPSAEGDKYRAAQQWSVPAVTSSWLIKCAEDKRKALEAPYLVSLASGPKQLDTLRVMKALTDAYFGRSHQRNSLSDAVVLGPTPINRKVRTLRAQHGKSTSEANTSIHTPDAETIRKMYPTPCIPNDNLQNMKTPETPYGSLFHDDPSPDTRKRFKRLIDSLSEDHIPSKVRPIASPDTPEGVYLQKFMQKSRDILTVHKVPSPVKDEVSSLAKVKASATDANTSPKDPLKGVVVYVSKKCQDLQQELNKAVTKLGGQFRWTYDSSVTHFVHYGRLNDTSKDFRLAREQSKVIVAPNWVWMCQEESRRIDEKLFPHTHNPKLSLSLVSSKSTPIMRTKRLVRAKAIEDDTGEVTEEERSSESQNMSASEDERAVQQKLDLSRELEELTAMAVPSTSNLRKSLSGNVSFTAIKPKSTTDKSPEQIQEPDCKYVAGSEMMESQGTAITWDDPQEREARLHLRGMASRDTQEILESVEKQLCSGPKHQDRKSYIFSLSGLSSDEKDIFSSEIEKLGAQVSQLQNFDPCATHIVTAKPSRSQKHLAAIASGKWLVAPAFIEDSIKAGEFVREEEYEWGNPGACKVPSVVRNSMELRLSRASHRWRKFVTRTGKGAFSGMKAVLLSTPERVVSFCTLIEAGGGTVIDPSSLEEPGVVQRVTHCFVEMNKGKFDLTLFAQCCIPCLSPVFLNDLLVEDPQPTASNCCVPEYQQLQQSLGFGVQGNEDS